MTRAGLRPSRLVRQWLGQHEFVGFGARVLTVRDGPFGLGAAVGRDDASVGMAGPEYAQYARRALAQALEGAALVLVGPDGPELGEDAIPGREGRLARSFARPCGSAGRGHRWHSRRPAVQPDRRPDRCR